MLKPHQAELLREICRVGAVPSEQIDGRALRPLVGHGFVTVFGGAVRPTPSGRSRAAQGDSPSRTRPDGSSLASTVLSEKQEDVLRYLLRQTGPVPADHLDGRALRALSSRGLIEETNGWVRPSSAAESYLRLHSQKTRQLGRRRAASSARSARGDAILRAVEQLEQAVPLNSELTVGGHPAYADDVIAGLRKLAREME
jgi:hypothetical protein